MFPLVIPFDSECRIKFPLRIDFDFVQLFECLDEMLCMLISNILNSKVIKNEGEGDGYGFMGPESWGEFYRLISLLLQVFLNISFTIPTACGRAYTPFKILI